MDKQTREGVEACRPASDDLQSPELADVARRVQNDPQARLVFERVQEFDAAILKSIDDVEVAPNLSDRILECLRAARGETANGHSDELLAATVAAATETFEPAAVPDISPSGGRRALSRRNLTGAALTLVLACVLVVVMFGLLQESGDQPIEVLADRWHDQLGADWQNAAKMPAGYEVPAAVPVASTGYQWIDRFSHEPVVAYRLDHPTAGKAMLYVARKSRHGLPSAPPLEPQSSSGKAIAHWQSGSRLYVLVVDNPQDYPAFVRASTAPFA